MMIDAFEDSMGVDYEKLYTAMVTAQLTTGLCAHARASTRRRRRE